MLKKLAVVAHTEFIAEFSGEYQFARFTSLALGGGQLVDFFFCRTDQHSLDLIHVVKLKELAVVADAEQLAESSIENECAHLTFHSFGCGKLVG